MPVVITFTISCVCDASTMSELVRALCSIDGWGKLLFSTTHGCMPNVREDCVVRTEGTVSRKLDDTSAILLAVPFKFD